MVLVAGSLAFDYIMDFPGSFADHIDPEKIHILNLSFLVETLKKEKGGTAGNIAYNLALLGQKVTILATAGSDFDDYNSFLKNAGVDISRIKIIDNESSALAFIMTDKKDNQITSFYPGAMKKASSLSLQNIPQIDFVVIAPNSPQAMKNFVRECKKLKVPFMYDPGMQLPRLSDDEIKEGINEAWILIGNDYEVGLMKSRLKLTDSDFLKKVKILITTLGDQGSIVQTLDQQIKVLAIKTNSLTDPTGAGDAYRAGFLAAYLSKNDLETCAKVATLTACYAVEEYGTTNHYFTMEEFKKRYQENFGKELNL